VGIVGISLIGIGLAMDAFAVAVCKGLSMRKMNWRKAIIIGLYFGAFQAIMPIIGYYLGRSFENVISNIGHWIAFVLLVLIGIKMIRESRCQDIKNANERVNFISMTVLAIATSIDALAVGVTFAFLDINIWLAATLIGLITFTLAIAGVKIGNIFGDRYKKGAGIFGGIILILMGCKILLENLL